MVELSARLAERHGRPVPLWDFSGYNAYTSEPVPSDDSKVRMKWYYESSHFRWELGDLVLERILPNPPSADSGDERFVVRLSPANIEQHLDSIGRDRGIYAPAYPQDVAFVQTLYEDAIARD